MTWKLAVSVVPPASESARADSLSVEMCFKFGGNQVLTKEWRERQSHVRDARIESLERKEALLLGLICAPWVDEQIGKGQFWSFSHGTEAILEKLRDSEKGPLGTEPKA